MHFCSVFDIIRHEKTKLRTSIAIYDTWVTGKTSAMKWLDKMLSKWNSSKNAANPVKTENIWFYPWKYHSKEEVWKGLIAEVIVKLIQCQTDIKKLEKGLKLFGTFVGSSIVDIISETEYNFGGVKLKGKALKSVIKNFKENNPPEKAYLNHYEKTFRDWVEDSLKDDQRMIVFIDDLDRCLPDVAFEVLESLKLYLNIPKLVFVLGIDIHG